MRVINTPLKKLTKMSPRSDTVCSKGRLGVVGTCENVVLHAPSLHCHDTDLVKEQAKQVASMLNVLSRGCIHSAGSI